MEPCLLNLMNQHYSFSNKLRQDRFKLCGLHAHTSVCVPKSYFKRFSEQEVNVSARTLTTQAMYPGPAQCLLRCDEAFVSPH